jgi:hypothetical protein
MSEALAWPVEYLSRLPDLEVPLFVNLGGMGKAMGVRTVAMCSLAGHFLQKTAPRIGIDRQRARGQRPSADVMPSE